MYSRGAVRRTLIMCCSYEGLQRGPSIYLHGGSCKQVRKFAYLQQHFPLGKILHPLISPVLRFIILELFLLLFIPCIQKSRKLFDCNEHILCAQYRASYFLRFQKLERLRPITAPNNRNSTGTQGSKHNSLTQKSNIQINDRAFDEAHILLLFQLVWNRAFYKSSASQSSNATRLCVSYLEKRGIHTIRFYSSYINLFIFFLQTILLGRPMCKSFC